MSVDRDKFAELLFRVEQTSNAMDRADALGYVVVTIDEYGEPSVTNCYGIFETAEQALVVAGEFDRADYVHRMKEAGEPGWKHVVVPLFEHRPKAGG